MVAARVFCQVTTSYKEIAMIRFEGVTKVYEGQSGSKDVLALHDINLEIQRGEFVFVIGHSGAGKSTFLKLMLREEIATEGEVYVNDRELTTMRERDVPYLRRSLGVVFQDFRLIPTMTAYENVAFAMRVTNISDRDIKRRVPYVLNLVGLSGKAHSFPNELSGGEQQRIALARALVHSPSIIIADEPTGNIDPELSVEIMELLQAINSVGTTVVVVTHEHELAQRFNKRTITIDHGELVSDVPPKPMHPVRQPQQRQPAQPQAMPRQRQNQMRQPQSTIQTQRGAVQQQRRGYNGGYMEGGK